MNAMKFVLGFALAGSLLTISAPAHAGEGDSNKAKFVELKNQPMFIGFQRDFSKSAVSQTFKKGNCSVTFSAGKVDGQVNVGLSGKDGSVIGKVSGLSCSAGVSAALLDASAECGWNSGSGGTRAGAKVSTSAQDGVAVLQCDCKSGCEVFFGSRVQGEATVNLSVCGLGAKVSLAGEVGEGIGGKVALPGGFKKGKGFTLGGSAYIGVGAGGSVSVLPKFDGLGKKTLSCLADKGYAALKFVGGKVVAVAGTVKNAIVGGAKAAGGFVKGVGGAVGSFLGI